MCIICDSLDNLSLAPWEARNNLKEIGMGLTTEHVDEVLKKIKEKESK